MSPFHIVTDSGARLTHSRTPQQVSVTVVPNRVEIGGRSYREGVDLSHEEALRLIGQSGTVTLTAPSMAEFATVYAHLASSSDGILSIHASRELSQSWQHAREAAAQLGDACPIDVVDSRSICAGQGMLVRLAVETASHVDSFDQLVKTVRGAVDRTYSVYCVETLDYLRRNRYMEESRAILGTLLGIRPFVSIEDGALSVIEKVRTRAQAIERLVEFLVEFDQLDDAVIVQSRSGMNEQVRALQDRLAIEFPDQHFPFVTYGAALASLVGPDALGVVVLEAVSHPHEDDLDED